MFTSTIRRQSQHVLNSNSALYFSKAHASNKVIILGAAGRDFHNFNMVFRDTKNYDVVAFIAHSIPDIAGRVYPSMLAGKLYPKGIPIYEEEKLEELIKKHHIDKAVFAYSDVSHNDVMHVASRALSSGADFWILGPNQTRIKSKKPVIAVLASRTGCGKSQTSRQIVEVLSKQGYKIVAIRHPMPYGDLTKQIVQRFATMEDLAEQNCTIEEREEYEPYVSQGAIIYSGIDYEKIIKEAEKEADIILWDGGNNDWSFYYPDIQICVVDPHRPGHEQLYHPGETNVRNSDIIVINKVDTAKFDDIMAVRANIEKLNPNADVVEAASPISVQDRFSIKNKRVLVVEDGPTLTHGGMIYGAGIVAAKRFGAKEIIDPRPFAVGTLKNTFKNYSYINNLIPAMGYGKQQMKDLEQTINNSDADVVVAGTPIDLSKIINVNKPVVRAKYDLQCIGQPDLHELIKERLDKLNLK